MFEILLALVNSVLLLSTGLLSARALGQWGRLRHIEQLSDAAKKVPEGVGRTRLEARADQEAQALVQRLERRTPPGFRLAGAVVILVIVLSLIVGINTVGWTGPTLSRVFLYQVADLQGRYVITKHQAIVAMIAGDAMALLVALSIELVVWTALRRLLPVLAPHVRRWSLRRLTDGFALIWGWITAPRPTASARQRSIDPTVSTAVQSSRVRKRPMSTDVDSRRSVTQTRLTGSAGMTSQTLRGRP